MKKIEYVDPMIGTVGDEQQTSMHGGGKTYPGAVVPGGMVQCSPDTVTGGDNGTGYNYCHNTIEGFSINHMSGIGWYGDLGNLQIMPIIGTTDLRSGSNEEVLFLCGEKGWKSEFTHENEKASAGYYAVNLQRYGIWAEATADVHVGQLRFTFPQACDAGIIFNFSRRIAGHADFQHVEITDDGHIQGYIRCTPSGGGFGRGDGGIGYTLYFACEVSKSADQMLFFENETICEEHIQIYEGTDVGLLLRFATDECEAITVQCGISYTDLEGAKFNLASERKSFDQMKQHAQTLWENALACVNVKGENETDKTLFYTCLYHALLDPRTAADADGRFRCADGQIRTETFVSRTMFSGWDVFRSEFPLLTLIRPNIVNDVVNSLLSIAMQKNGSFPRWELMGIDSGCMVGDPGLLVFADAYMKGIRGYNVDRAYDICRASVQIPSQYNNRLFRSIHPDTAEYRDHAFVANKLSDTLEFLLADYAMYRVANALCKETDAAYFADRFQTYPNNYNPNTGFMGPRNSSGNFIPTKNEYDTCGCVESNIFQQSWFVPYDVEGLSALFGKERMIALLERLFEQADLTALWNENYNHSNEPCHNLTHYFNLLGLPQRTQYWTRRVQKEAYRLGAFGFCGNEDVGQLSAWYVLSALGLAQICPADPIFQLNTPLFTESTISLDSRYHACAVAEIFTIRCDKSPLEFPYIKQIYLNGEKIERTYLTYAEITNGGELWLVLSEKGS